MIPISPVRETWVPPQSSVEKAGFEESGKLILAGGRKAHRQRRELRAAIFLPEKRAARRIPMSPSVDTHQAGHDGFVLPSTAWIGDVLDAG